MLHAVLWRYNVLNIITCNTVNRRRLINRNTKHNRMYFCLAFQFTHIHGDDLVKLVTSLLLNIYQHNAVCRRWRALWARHVNNGLILSRIMFFVSGLQIVEYKSSIFGWPDLDVCIARCNRAPLRCCAYDHCPLYTDNRGRVMVWLDFERATQTGHI